MLMKGLLQVVLMALLGGWAAGQQLEVAPVTYMHGEEEAAAFAIETDWYRAVLVPDMGGRILEWTDKETGIDLVYDAGYGGLLDDHGARLKQPYSLRWLRQDAHEAVAELTLDGLVSYRKTLYFHADRPAIRVTYLVANHGQEPHRMLFRNVIRPAGTTFTDDEQYAFSRVAGLQFGPNMGRTDDIADPWMALVSPERQMVVGAAFQGNQLARVYSWLGSKVAPTFEFMLHQLEAGHQVEQAYTWVFAHGLTSVDYVHSHVIAQWQPDTLQLVATWEPLPELNVAVTLLDAQRQEVGSLPPATVRIEELGNVATLPLNLADSNAAIAIATLTAPQLPEPIVLEQVLPVGSEPPADYQRPVRWLGEPNEPTPIEGWQPEIAYEVQPSEADRERGWMIFGEAGPEAGRQAAEIRLHLAQREYESFPLRLRTLGTANRFTLRTESDGVTMETFLPEEMPETLWGRTYTGYKLVPGTGFELGPDDERLIYVRLQAGDLPAGEHEARLIVQPATGEAETVRLALTLHPVRIPHQRYMSFDASNVVNYLAADKIKGQHMEWNLDKARSYLEDMRAHGVRGQTTIGVNSPVSYFWYDKINLRETGQSLTEAIAEHPEWFRHRLDLPDLDFSEYDMLTEEIVRYGNLGLRWPMGSTGEGFLSNQMKLTARIYGQPLPPGDLRHQVIQEWYFRQVGRYFSDRGIPQLRVTIDDEIPSEELAWWAQHAYRSQQMGFMPSVTQSAKTMANDTVINFVAPFMEYWIVGTLHEETIARRRAQGIIKPWHWFTTYHSSANHWQPYDQMRGHCGINGAYFDLDAVWIQTYYRWRQAEAVIYPTATGPLSSAAWEGARDGLEDGNYLLLARRLIEALPSDQQAAWQARLTAIVGRGEDATIRFTDRLTGVGLVTQLGRFDGEHFRPGADTWTFRRAKRQLLALIDELAPLAPVQPAAAKHGRHALIREGQAVLRLPEGMPQAQLAAQVLRQAAAPLEVQITTEAAADQPYPVFFLGSLAELQELLPALADHPDLADLSEHYPLPDQYAIRWLSDPDHAGDTEAPESLVIIAPDDAGIRKAAELFPQVITQPRALYSHWLPAHWPEGTP